MKLDENVLTLDDDCQRDRALFAEHVRSQFETEAAAATDAHRVEVLDFDALQRRRQLEKHLHEKIRVDLAISRALTVTATSGGRVISPPYDREWSEGNGFAFNARNDCTVYTLPRANGFSGGGIGFFVSTNESALVGIAPQGDYNWNWASFADLPFVRGRGGMGITIFRDGQLESSLQSVLFDVSGATSCTGQSGSGRIADAAGPALVHIEPGSQYLVWVWCWQTIAMQPNDPFLAFMSFYMPFVAIETGLQIPPKKTRGGCHVRKDPGAPHAEAW